MNDHEVLTVRIWNESQSWHFEKVIKVDGVVFRASIRRNAYDVQSYGRVNKWTNDGWRPVLSRSIGELQCKQFSYVTKLIEEWVFEGDADRMLGDALSVCLPDENHRIGSKLTTHDVNQCATVHENLQVPCEFCDNGQCDCQDSETVILSTGYAEVWKNGEVIQHGSVVWRADA